MDQALESVDVSIKWPFKWTLVGSSGSGKTNFALNIIKKSARLFDQKPDRVIIIYKVFQEIYNTFDEYLPTSHFTEEECDLRIEGMDFPIPPEFWWSMDILSTSKVYI